MVITEKEKESLERFPQWVRSLVNRLSEENGRLRHELEAIRGNTVTRIWVGGFLEEKPEYIPENETVSFKVGEGRNRDVIRVSLSRPAKDRIYINGNTIIEVIPQASNAVEIRLRKD